MLSSIRNLPSPNAPLILYSPFTMSRNIACKDRGIAAQDPGEEIVISGIAGRFPDSDNIRHLKANLFNKIDLISDDDRRWKLSEFLNNSNKSFKNKIFF